MLAVRVQKRIQSLTQDRDHFGEGTRAEMASWSRLVMSLLVALGGAACGGRADPLANAADCLRDHGARVAAEPKFVTKMSAERKWTIRRFLIGRNGLSLLWAPTEDSAHDAYARIVAAQTAVDPSRPRPRRVQQTVYWWDEPPSRFDRETLIRCVRGTAG